MIHGIFANQPTFHPVEFTAGLNVVLAERTDSSTEKDTRNGLGKSTLLEIIDFCLGSRATRGKGLIQESLANWSFTIEITLSGNRVKATRNIVTPNVIRIEGPTSGWIEQPSKNEETGEYFYKLEHWKTLLGWSIFGLPRSNDSFKYKPTYRSLISYFVRRSQDAYSEPFRHFRVQKTWDIQMNVAYLLGLNWEYADQWQRMKDSEDGIKAIDKAIKTGVMDDMVGTVGELEAQRIQLEQETRIADSALASFKVYPQYESVQAEADRITAKLHELANQNVSDRRRLNRYKDSVTDESPPKSHMLEKLYEESGLVFPDAVRRTLFEAKQFHERIIKNRREFLETEITRLERGIHDRDSQIEQLTDSRASSLEILRTHGALQEMTKLQERNIETKGQLDKVRTRIREIKDLNLHKQNLKIAKAELVKVAEQDHEQRRDTWSKAVRLFNDHSHALYETPGKLVIDIGETGYKFQVEIERSDSEGIGKMKIFCFDLTLLQAAKKYTGSIDFLIHDSILYDSVDSRQRALALERASKITELEGVQYICTLNSDMVPYDDFSDGFNFSQYVSMTLTDKTQSGSLLGVRF